MFDLKQISPILSAKLGVAVTIMVLTSACAHEVLITPSNNDSNEVSAQAPEPMGLAQASTVSAEPSQKTPARRAKHAGRKIARHARAHKTTRFAQNSRAHQAPKAVHAAATVAAAPVIQAPAAPEIAPPSLPAPLASAGVQTEIDGDYGNHFGTYIIYALGALALAGLIYVAPRARRSSKPKRKLVYNG